ncbi:MAG: STAS domain-containing protein [Desulfobacterales bacterium]
MDIIEKKHEDYSVFKLTGRLDSNTSLGFEKKLFEAIENGTQHLILDFEGLDYISSAGLRVILKATKNLKNTQGSLVLCAMQDYVKEVFEISGFDSFLPIVPSVDEAMQTFRGL